MAYHVGGQIGPKIEERLLHRISRFLASISPPNFITSTPNVWRVESPGQKSPRRCIGDVCAQRTCNSLQSVNELLDANKDRKKPQNCTFQSNSLTMGQIRAS